ncbi:hypothetical protein [Brevundimonas vesicularis]|uniref:Isochorismatase family n=1 Tax=Brevundimonas vesicularis TaxID=41276 RepID=A0ABU4KQK2_BREVE|nr:hypothetical protein [Brevundimonas vesicularis]MDX2335267.1 hypothetical protein [Brevundimonas vesicularis]
MADGLIRGAIPETAVHLCIDMQRMFAEDTPWRTPWMERVLPVVVGLCERKPERTWFTRFIPAAEVGEGWGTWRGYWERWPEMTIERLGPERIDLIPALAAFVPPARVLDKRIYSPGRAPGSTTPCAPAASTPWSSPERRPTSACWPPFWVRSISAIG